jgi:Helix-turn-helix domain
MRRTEALQGVRMIRFLDVFGRYEASDLSQLEAADLLGMGERTFRRWCHRYEEDGEAGLLDRRLGKASGKRVPVDREAEVEALYRERYPGFTLPGATRGPRRFCSRRACWNGPGSVVPTVANDHDGPCPACCCTRTAHAMTGCKTTRRLI